MEYLDSEQDWGKMWGKDIYFDVSCKLETVISDKLRTAQYSRKKL